MRRFILFFASNAGLGYAPVASGTFGTLAGVLVFYLLAPLPAAIYLMSWAALLFLSFWICDAAGIIYGQADDGRIVIDELVGYLATVALLPFSWRNALLGFVFFRLFDIVKPPPARQIDRHMKNGIGVVLDDVVAGLYGALALRLALNWLP
ncbi:MULTISPECIES: phosphatidylglycerophosphatase A family protein [Syntrophotalea]|jgi:phosphatidylglycerophosphatase A|uniref:Phosphatidylglycerophosphatase A n=1 Tax=Syntrophotalea acetylenica TaxID=29542 RepID=A0A1L3GGY2_SYNAC|nr:phosphatidylglycerophosphatase A [Syntrophotalea acetylenica]APG25203.1 phosphatidylglycerophosphatase A [Syntrophotalea acetylenica]APG43271.1 phosphatidylglycerophosphatase A [Syntrophotalea acetylenica]MDY0261477.1 phosphatidylglycerophosphatase A [Syntrophotalea acetylenica]